MICSRCRNRPATIKAIEATTKQESLFCPECWSKFVGKSPLPAPTPRFQIRHAMVLVVVFAVPNALLAWLIRFAGPKSSASWSTSAFLGVNATLGVFALTMLIQRHLAAVAWHRATGGLVARPKPRHLKVWEALAVIGTVLLSSVWLLGCIYLTSQDRPWMAQVGDFGFAPLGLVFVLPYAAIVAVVPRWRHATFVRLRPLWTFPTWTARLVYLLFHLWMPVVLLVLAANARRIAHGASWYTAPVLLIVFLGGQAVLLAALIAATSPGRK
jgi:hypothetical protein